MHYLIFILIFAVSAIFPQQAQAQLFGDHSERQWLEGEVGFFDPLQIIEEHLEHQSVDVSLTYVYAKAHENVHLVGSLRYLHPITETGQSHRGYGGGLRLYKWNGYAQGLIGEIDGELDVVVSAGYFISPRIGIRANWYAGAEDQKAGHVSAGIVWRF
ncbi:MAG: hypothetical protein OXO51_16035 [Gemmatimonadota bacterium]|nr:hypothetical protein [Gemmatimonadota bacterium]